MTIEKEVYLCLALFTAPLVWALMDRIFTCIKRMRKNRDIDELLRRHKKGNATTDGDHEHKIN